jgi:hypothetical protein
LGDQNQSHQLSAVEVSAIEIAFATKDAPAKTPGRPAQAFEPGREGPQLGQITTKVLAKRAKDAQSQPHHWIFGQLSP